MIEEIKTIEELTKKYSRVAGRLPKKNDLVYIAFLGGIHVVLKVDGNSVIVERDYVGSSKMTKVPPSQYMLVEEVK